MSIIVENLIDIARQAGEITLQYFRHEELEIGLKADRSVFTKADLLSNQYICDALKKFYPKIPVLSEEDEQNYPYEIRKGWEYFFLVDPLDGSKEFIHGQPEFTINIALINQHIPVLGVIYAPALGTLYYAERQKGAFKINNHGVPIRMPLADIKPERAIRVAVSRSHRDKKTEEFITRLEQCSNTAMLGIKLDRAVESVSIIAIGSALKFGLIAENAADFYPRFSPTMEWDTAAGQVLVNEVGKQVHMIDSDQELQYNKESLINPPYIVY